jgi:F-type H+-transporting ATPase subunit gamma
MFNALKLSPSEREVLPLDEKKMHVTRSADDISSVPQPNTAPFEYIPSAEEVFDRLAPLYIKGVIYGCLVESYACEQSARMSAMDDASKNGEEMLASQLLYYNRVRQASITQEITEIVGGAAALGT